MEQLLQEVAFVAYHFHWSQQEIYAMPHAERRQWMERISRLNRVAVGED